MQAVEPLEAQRRRRVRARAEGEPGVEAHDERIIAGAVVSPGQIHRRSPKRIGPKSFSHSRSQSRSSSSSMRCDGSCEFASAADESSRPRARSASAENRAVMRCRSKAAFRRGGFEHGLVTAVGKRDRTGAVPLRKLLRRLGSGVQVHDELLPVHRHPKVIRVGSSNASNHRERMRHKSAPILSLMPDPAASPGSEYPFHLPERRRAGKSPDAAARWS